MWLRSRCVSLLVSAIFNMDTRLMFWSVVISHCFLLPIMWVRGGFPAPQRLALMLRSSEIRGTALAFLAFGLPMTVFFLSSVLLDVGDRYVVNFFMGPGAVGVYDANYRLIAGVVVLMVAPITITLHPHLMKIAGSGDTKTVEQMIGNVIENLLLVGALTVGLTFLLHEDIARVLLGHEFRAGSVVMPAVVAGVFFFNIGTFAHKPFEIVGRTRVMLVFGVIAAAANIGLCFALIPLLGYVGAAYATLLSYLLYTVCVGYLGRRIFPWRVNLRRLATYGRDLGWRPGRHPLPTRHYERTSLRMVPDRDRCGELRPGFGVPAGLATAHACAELAGGITRNRHPDWNGDGKHSG